jgi:branched-chain amino acid transport system permease protein
MSVKKLFSETTAQQLSGPNTNGISTQFWLGFLVVVAAALFYPLVASEYRVGVATGILIWVLTAYSLSIVWGYTGIFSFAQSAFFGIGGYAFGIIGINIVDITGATNVAVLGAMLVPAAIASLIGYFMFYGRVGGVSVAIITLAVSLIIELLFSQTSRMMIGQAEIGGFRGMRSIPTMTFGYDQFTVTFTPILKYYLVISALLITYLGLRYVVNSKYGYVMLAVREDNLRTQMFGYDTRLVKLGVFAFGAALAGFGGALFASRGNFIDPSLFGLTTAALPVIWVTVGGRDSLTGATVATIVLQYLSDALAQRGITSAIIIVGIVLLIVVRFFPSGVIPMLADKYTDRQDSAGTRSL